MEEVIQKIISALREKGIEVKKKKAVFYIYMPYAILSMRVAKEGIEIRTANRQSSMWISKVFNKTLLSFYSNSAQLSHMRASLKEMLSEELTFPKLIEEFCNNLVDSTLQGIVVFKGGEICARLAEISGYTFDISLNKPMDEIDVQRINSMINFFIEQKINPGRRFHLLL